MSDTNRKPNGADAAAPTHEELMQEQMKRAAAAMQFLQFATTKYGDKIGVLPFHVNAARTRRRRVRKTLKGERHEAAQLCLIVPDEMVANILGDPEKIDVFFVMRIPRFVLERFNSNIVLPGDR